jgi:8-oxo-dGTP pyrophosphatase MutT (NUDIX family)
MHYNVYFGNKEIEITDKLSDSSDSVFSFLNVDIDSILQKMQAHVFNKIVLYHPNIDEAWKIFQKQFDVIEAAGGIVENDKKQHLFIYRNGIWDLPKGKMEKGESIEETAIREVQEECGIQNIKIDRFLLKTYHLFTENRKKRLKITHWFKMTELEKSELIPQTEEGIEKVEWIDINKHTDFLKNSYENIKMLIAKL